MKYLTPPTVLFDVKWNKSPTRLEEISHAYLRKYSRLSALDASLTLGRLYSLFSQSPVEKQHSVVFLGRLPTSTLGRYGRMNVDREVVDRRSTMGANKKDHRLVVFLLAPPAGLEPATSWLTVMRSTDWAKEEYDGFLRVLSSPFALRRMTSCLLPSKNNTQLFFSVAYRLS